MRDRPTGRLWRRMAALGLLAGLGLGVWHLAISPVWQEIRATETALAKAQARQAGLNTRISRLKAALAAPQAGPVALPLWSGPSDGARAARIQGAVQALARGHEIALRAVSARGDRTFHDRPAIGVLVEARAPYDRAARLLHAVETHEPVLLVEKASLRLLGQPRTDQIYPEIQVRLELLAPLTDLQADP